MKLVAFLAGCLVSAPLCALEQVGNVFTLTDAENAACADGCSLIPNEILKSVLRQKMRESYEDGMTACQGRNRL